MKTIAVKFLAVFSLVAVIASVSACPSDDGKAEGEGEGEGE